jgi:hypothetical protein
MLEQLIQVAVVGGGTFGQIHLHVGGAGGSGIVIIRYKFQ